MKICLPLKAVLAYVLFAVCNANANGMEPCATQDNGMCDDVSSQTTPLHITEPLRNYTVEFGETVTFTCKAEGSGVMSLHWTVTNESGDHMPHNLLTVVTVSSEDSIESNCTMMVLILETSYVVNCTVMQQIQGKEHRVRSSTGNLLVLYIPPMDTFPLSIEPSSTTSSLLASVHPNVAAPDKQSGLQGEITAIVVTCVVAVLVILLLSTALCYFIRHKINTAHKEGLFQGTNTKQGNSHSSSSSSVVPPATCTYLNPFLPLRVPTCSKHGMQPEPCDQTTPSMISVGTSTTTSHVGEENDCFVEIDQLCKSSDGEDFSSNFLQVKNHITKEGKVLSADTAHCTIPNCLCQTHRCKYYDGVYEQKIDPLLLPAPIQLSSASIAPIAKRHPLDKPTLPKHSLGYDHSNVVDQAMNGVSTLRTIEPCGYCSPSIKSIPFIDPLEIIQCDTSGGVYYNPVHDFVLRIPEGAIPHQTSITIEVGVALHGPFEFSEDLRAVSPIVWLCVQQQGTFEFAKDVEIILPHYINVTCGGDKHLSAMKAMHSTNTRKKYKFNPIENLDINNSYGSICTKHFCFLCIAAKLTPEDTAKANYCLIRVQPDPVDEPHWIACFCVAYFLQTCIEAVRRQYPTGYNITIKRFNFTGSGHHAEVKISFQRELQGGWILALDSDSKIAASDVNFWDIETSELELMQKEKMYPPRFVVEVAGEGATRNCCSHIHFDGVDKNVDTEIPLRVVASGSKQLVLVPSSESLHSLSMVHPYQLPGMPGSYYNSLYAPPIRGWNSQNYLPEDYPTNEELEEVAKEVMGKLQLDWIMLQVFLDIPDDVMLEVLSESTIRQRVRRMLREWRDQSEDGSRSRLAECLKAADPRLLKAANKLISGEYRTLTPSTSRSSSTRSTSSIASISSLARRISFVASSSSLQESVDDGTLV